MPDETGKSVKDGLKKGVGIVGKIIKWFLIIVGIIIVLLIVYSLYTSGTETVVDVTSSRDVTSRSIEVKVTERSTTTGDEDPVKMASEAVSVSAIDLWTVYDGNAVKADNTYRGKAIRLTGKVSKVDKDLFDKPYVALNYDLDNPDRDNVHVYFKKSEVSKLADLYNGQTITIVGKCEGKAAFYKDVVDIKDSFFE